MRLVEGFVPGGIGAVAAMHGTYYAREWRLAVGFEATVARDLGAFALRLTSRDLALLALEGDVVRASLFVDSEPGPRFAGGRLRWIIADDGCRGTGVGKRMMDRAMEHIDTVFGGAAWLTTFGGLDAARSLYERHGFRLTGEERSDALGVPLDVQTFARGRHA